MSLMTVCPQCEKQVGVPDGTHPTAQVQCPLCESKFTLGESVPDDLPEIVILDPGFVETTVEGSAAAVADEATSESAAQADAATGARGDEAAWFGEDGATGLETPDGDVSFDPFGDGGDDAEVTTKEATADADDKPEESDGDGTPDFGFMATADEKEKDGDSDSPDFAGFGNQADDDGEAFASFGSSEESDGEGGVATTAAPAKKKKGVGLKGQVIGVVVFGVIGLVLGYGILKLIKPAAAEPIDRMIGDTWTSVASLWGGESEPVGEDSADDIASTDPINETPAEDEGFVIGGMLDEDKRQKADDVAKANGQANANKRNGNNRRPRQPGAQPKMKDSFRALLGGPDDTNVFADHEPTATAAALDKALELGGDPDSKLASVYFALCELGLRLAVVPDVNDPEVKVQVVDAENIIRIVAVPDKQSSFGKFSGQWLHFEKRPEQFREKRGVFLVGKVSRVRKKVQLGKLSVTEVEVGSSGDKEKYLVVTTSPPDLGNGDPVGVLGMTVQNAGEKLREYDAAAVAENFDADAGTLILGAAFVKLDKAED